MTDLYDLHVKASIGAGAVLLLEQKVLLVQINYGPFKKSWILPGGMVQPNEHPHQAAARETKEETGLEVEITHQIALRYRILEKENANLYFVFMAKLVTPVTLAKITLVWPPEEILCAKFWPIAEALCDQNIRPMTQMFIKMATEQNPENIAKIIPPLSGNIFNDSIYGHDIG